MGNDKTEIRRTIIYHLRERRPKTLDKALLNPGDVFRYISSIYDVSESTLRRWYKENEEFKNQVDTTIYYDWQLNLNNIS